MKTEVLKGHGDSANGNAGRGLPSLTPPPGRAKEGHSRAPRVTRVLPPLSVGVHCAWSTRSRLRQRDGSPGEHSCGSEAFADTRLVCVTLCSRATVRTWLAEGESVTLRPFSPAPPPCSTPCVCPSSELSPHAPSWVPVVACLTSRSSALGACPSALQQPDKVSVSCPQLPVGLR